MAKVELLFHSKEAVIDELLKKMKEKKVGPDTDPWGTPFSTLSTLLVTARFFQNPADFLTH